MDMGLNTFPCNPYPISTEELHKGDNEDLQAQINAIKDGTDIDSFGDVETALGIVSGDITNLGTSKVAKTDIAPTFSAEGTYAVGDLVYYEGVLYECTTAHEAAAWDAEDFTATSVDEELSAINSNLTNVGAYNAASVKVGTWLGNDLYRVVKDIGALPNSTSKFVDVSIGNKAQVVSLRGFAYGVDGHTIPIPFISANQTVDRIEIGYSKEYSQLKIITTMDMSTYGGYVVIDYYIAS